MQPQLEHEAAVALVEVEADAPRRADQPLEALVDPARDLLLERAVGAAVRQVRLGRGEAVQERLDRAVAAERPRRPEPDAGRDEPVARDLVDEPRIEVVDGRDAVAVEVVGDHRRRRGGDPRQRLLDLGLERRAPEREPLAADLGHLREDEALGDRAARELADVQERARAVGERLVGLPSRELVGREEAPAVGVAEDVELVLAGRGAVAREREGDGVGVPQELEHGQAS